eukprot:1206561-Amphidinium_carterae.1
MPWRILVLLSMTLTNRLLTGWEAVSKSVRHFWVLVAAAGASACPEALPELPAEVLPKPPFEVGPQNRVVEFAEFARCLDCLRQEGRFRATFNYLV